jgi:L-ascorbate metabolism protein UlaG (beta-lactamase superfamily)
VLITHEHADHMDTDKLTDALAKRREVSIFTHPEVTPKLGDLRDLVTEVVSGDEFTAAGFSVRAYGGLHAMIHPDVPRVANVGFFIEGMYDPGDSFDVPEDADVDTLFVPISAPWLKVAESIEFVRAVAPRRAFALHDSLLSEAGYKVTDANMARLSRCDYSRLAAGETVQI